MVLALICNIWWIDLLPVKCFQLHLNFNKYSSLNGVSLMNFMNNLFILCTYPPCCLHHVYSDAHIRRKFFQLPFTLHAYLNLKYTIFMHHPHESSQVSFSSCSKHGNPFSSRDTRFKYNRAIRISNLKKIHKFAFINSGMNSNIVYIPFPSFL